MKKRWGEDVAATLNVLAIRTEYIEFDGEYEESWVVSAKDVGAILKGVVEELKNAGTGTVIPKDLTELCDYLNFNYE